MEKSDYEILDILRKKSLDFIASKYLKYNRRGRSLIYDDGLVEEIIIDAMTHSRETCTLMCTLMVNPKQVEESVYTVYKLETSGELGKS